jgi:hypothetical protein
VDLGDEDSIAAATHAFRDAIIAIEDVQGPGTALRKLTWEKIAVKFAGQPRAVLVSAEGFFHAIPWAALPGRKAGTVLLEEFPILSVPTGPFLLEHLTAAPPPRGSAPLRILAVDQVAYGSTSEEPPTKGALSRAPEQLKPGAPWGPLSRHEALHRLLATPTANHTAVVLDGAKASAWQVREQLAAADIAYLETHGSYAKVELQGELRLDPALLLEGREGGELLVPGRRHPLALCALACAGANLPGEGSNLNYLTGESISALPLLQLNVAILAACVTAQGDIHHHEGIMGLPRAFHVAGARNVVASLWKVPHKESGDLMEQFFRNLFDAKLPPYEALRQAQLKMKQKGQAGSKHPFYWAAWVISGVPDELNRAGALPH